MNPTNNETQPAPQDSIAASKVDELLKAQIEECRVYIDRRARDYGMSNEKLNEFFGEIVPLSWHRDLPKQPAPQDLRERWQKLRTDAVSEMFETGPDKDGIYRTTALYKKLDAAFDLLAAEVAGEKDRGISELGEKLKDQNSMIADLWETIDESNQRIAELEDILKYYKNPYLSAKNISTNE